MQLKSNPDDIVIANNSSPDQIQNTCCEYSIASQRTASITGRCESVCNVNNPQNQDECPINFCTFEEVPNNCITKNTN